jgi:hypothetical protein
MLYGMQGMSDVAEVRSVLGMLPVAGRLQEPLDQAVGNMLYGMQGMSSDVAEVRSVLGMLPWCWAARVAEAQAVGNMLYGMQGMSSDVGGAFSAGYASATAASEPLKDSGGGQYAVRYGA